MKMIRAIIQPFRVEAVRDALQQKGIMGMTSYQSQGCGRQRRAYAAAAPVVVGVPALRMPQVALDRLGAVVGHGLVIVRAATVAAAGAG